MKLLRVFVLLLVPAAYADVTAFTSCRQFFANGVSPTVFPFPNRYKQICQCLTNPTNGLPIYFYATLYDTQNRVPVYSAYQYQQHVSNGRMQSWFIEPELDNINVMCMEGEQGRRFTNQAVNDNYDLNYQSHHFDRGHLYPVSHTNTPLAMVSTFTLTNAAPHDHRFNAGQWRVYETTTLPNAIRQHCPGARVYVVTGTTSMHGFVNGKVGIPSIFWSAYCCLNNQGQRVHSAGYIGENMENEVKGPIPVQQAPQGQRSLEDILSDQNHYNTRFSIFGGRC